MVVFAALGVSYVVQRGRVSKGDFTCGDCGTRFSVPPLTAMVAPHRSNDSFLRCPACGVRTWATPTPRTEDF